MRNPAFSQSVLVAAIAALTLSGCTDDTITYRDREPFNAPVDAAAGFLGYFTVANRQTTCGNCHADKQADWLGTAHANAFAAPGSTGHATAACFGCHTVSERGNAMAGPAGWNAVADSAVAAVYQDVQCESCHGPGVDHLANPGAVQPLASIAAGVTGGNGCGACHTGAHQPFVEQWSASAHASPSASAAARDECSVCHEGRRAMEVLFGVRAHYLEENAAEVQPITCAVCHDPHGGPYGAQLRREVSVEGKDNLCVVCHSRTPTPPSYRGPHAAQGPLVFGQQVGWFPPGFDYANGLAGAHGSVDANPRLCATCHVSFFEVLDQSNAFVFRSVGHSFEALPCVNAQGIPVPGPCSVDSRTFEACDGCHLPAGDAKASYLATIARLNALLDQIWYDTDGDGVIDATDGGLLPGVVGQGDTTALNVRDEVFTVAEGALWNAQLAFTDERPWFAAGSAFGYSFSAHATSGNGVHNPFLLEALLTASIKALAETYGLTPAPGFDPGPLLTPPSGAR